MKEVKETSPTVVIYTYDDLYKMKNSKLDTQMLACQMKLAELEAIHREKVARVVMLQERISDIINDK